MDRTHPKRRRDKFNPYTITEQGGRYFIYFRDGQAVPHSFEIDKTLYELFDQWELDDLSYLNVVDRRLEQSELTEASLWDRASALSDHCCSIEPR